MRNPSFTLAYGALLILGMAGPSIAQDNGGQQPSARQELQHIHTPQIDQELARLTKDLELNREQQRQVRPLLEEHHDQNFHYRRQNGWVVIKRGWARRFYGRRRVDSCVAETLPAQRS
jgi:hypothetical protein